MLNRILLNSNLTDKILTKSGTTSTVSGNIFISELSPDTHIIRNIYAHIIDKNTLPRVTLMIDNENNFVANLTDAYQSGVALKGVNYKIDIVYVLKS